MSDPNTARPITAEGPPVFPCELWSSRPNYDGPPKWFQMEAEPVGGYNGPHHFFTHWRPLQPTPPTCAPGEDYTDAPIGPREVDAPTATDVPEWATMAAIECEQSILLSPESTSVVDLARIITRHAPTAPVANGVREALARKLSSEHGCPDELEPGDAYGVDGYLPNGDPAHFNWRRFLNRADELIAVIAPYLATPPTDAVTDELVLLRAERDNWRNELSKVMPSDFKDWWENNPREWPLVARLCIENLEKQLALMGCSAAVTDTEIVDFLEANMTLLLTYSEPKNNGDLNKLKYIRRAPLRSTREEVCGSDVRSTVRAAIRAAKQGGAE